MPKAKVNKKKSWLYKAKTSTARKKIKRAEHKADRQLAKDDAETKKRGEER